MWIDLREDVEEMFEALASCVDVADLAGLRRHDYLNTSRATTGRERLSDEQLRANRRDLEQRRREYKTMKQREYRARAA